MAESVDARDLKSLGSHPVRVRVPPRALFIPTPETSSFTYLAIVTILATDGTPAPLSKKIM